MPANRYPATAEATVDDPRTATQASAPVGNEPGRRVGLFAAFRALCGSRDEKSAFERTRRWYCDGRAGPRRTSS